MWLTSVPSFLAISWSMRLGSLECAKANPVPGAKTDRLCVPITKKCRELLPPIARHKLALASLRRCYDHGGRRTAAANNWNSLIGGLVWTLRTARKSIFGVYEPVGPHLWRIPAGATFSASRHAARRVDGGRRFSIIETRRARPCTTRLFHATTGNQPPARRPHAARRIAHPSPRATCFSAFFEMGLRREASDPIDGWSPSFRIAPERPKSGCPPSTNPTSAG